jgi:phosphoglycerate dehydrogenase-like enzyme
MKIVSTAALDAAQRTMIEKIAPDAELVDRTCRTPDEISEMLQGGCDVLFTFRLPDDLFKRAPGLRWVQLLSAGADHAMRSPLRDSTVQVTTASGIHATPMAEYSIASMLVYSHRLHISIRAQARREWLRSGRFMATVDSLRGRTLAIIGYGSIGRETARLAQALGMTILALKRDPDSRKDPGWSPSGVGDPGGTIPERFFGPEERKTLLSMSDFAVVTLPLTDETRGFIGAAEFAEIKEGAYIVNVGRGEVIDQRAMIAALESKRLGGAGLDVFEREPLEAESKLWEIEDAILTPHMSGATRNYVGRACELFVENLSRFQSGRPLLNLVDRAKGY